MRPWVLNREIGLWIALLGNRPRQSHGLPAPLYVSIKSHPPRYRYLRPALLSLLAQDMRPDGVLLWIEQRHLAALPAGVRALRSAGLNILPCDDGLRSYGKIVPALEQFRDAYLVTADDDHIYPRDWLSGLVGAAAPDAIAYYRGHRMRFTPDGVPAPYRNWDWDIEVQLEGDVVVPTGVGGIIYPPRALDPRAIDRNLFQALAPTSDDLWLCWMARLQGSDFRKITPVSDPEALPTVNTASLSAINNEGPLANDTAVKLLMGEFGLPRAQK